jgi:hypothetical protein
MISFHQLRRNLKAEAFVYCGARETPEPLMDVIPDEMLIRLLTPLVEFSPALKMVCRRWNSCGQSLPERQTSGKGLSFLSRKGHSSLVCWVYTLRPLPYTVLQLNEMLASAAGGGHGTLAGTLKGWGATDVQRAARKASKAGHGELAKVLISWGTTGV